MPIYVLTTGGREKIGFLSANIQVYGGLVRNGQTQSMQGAQRRSNFGDS